LKQVVSITVYMLKSAICKETLMTLRDTHEHENVARMP